MGRIVINEKIRKKRAPKSPGNCRATGCPPHPADRRKLTGYCSVHELEYQRERLKFNNLTYNYRSGRTTVRPPSKEEFWNSVYFTPLSKPVTLNRHEIREILATLDKFDLLFKALKKSGRKYNETRGVDIQIWQDLKQLIDEYPTLEHTLRYHISQRL